MNSLVALLVGIIQTVVSLFTLHNAETPLPSLPVLNEQNTTSQVSQGSGDTAVSIRPALNVTAEQSTVTGMQKYTDTDFGFSFWYPKGWTVTEHQTTKAPDTYFPGGTVVKSYNITDDTGSFALSVSTIYSPDRTITDTGGAGPFGPIRYYFDVNSHTWMSQCPEGCPNGSDSLKSADTTRNTMGGLHMFGGTSRFDATIIPLSAHNFVYVIDGGGVDATFLAKTIVAIDPSVATPVSVAEQSNVIQAEKDAYTK